jgi:CheY-like chemotaxis protein
MRPEVSWETPAGGWAWTDVKSLLKKRADASARLSRAVGMVEDWNTRLARTLLANFLTRRVLVVDDDRVCLTATARLLGSSGIVVDAAGDFHTAKRLWDTHHHAVIVTDLFLKEEVNGLDLLLSIGRGPRAVLVTGEADNGTLLRAACVGGAVPRMKPAGDLPRLVNRLLSEATGEMWLSVSGESCNHASPLLAADLSVTEDDLLLDGWKAFVTSGAKTAILAALATANDTGKLATVTADIIRPTGIRASKWTIQPLRGSYCHVVVKA